jgi:hypothetical protein
MLPIATQVRVQPTPTRPFAIPQKGYQCHYTTTLAQYKTNFGKTAIMLQICITARGLLQQRARPDVDIQLFELTSVRIGMTLVSITLLNSVLSVCYRGEVMKLVENR